jgi:tRNA(adenine34) deaminase
MINSEEYFMREALKQAKIAFDKDEVPVGAVVVCKNTIVARAYNQTELLNDCTAHAEMIAITSAMSFLGAKYLTDCTLYVTLEPCVMCCGALYWSKISKLIFAASDEKNGFRKFNENMLHPKTNLEFGLLSEESESLLKAFFQKKRKIQR